MNKQEKPRAALSAPAQPESGEAVDVTEVAFEAWWLRDGQYLRAGGGDYEKTFAYHAWLASLSATDTTPPASQEQADASVLVAALRKLSCLGNGDQPGNSDGNRIAQQALEAWASQEQAKPSGTWVNFALRDIRHTDPGDEPGWVRVDAQPSGEVVAWCTPDGERCVTAKTMGSARKDGGAMLSSLSAYTVAAYANTAPQPAQAARVAMTEAKAKLWDALVAFSKAPDTTADALRDWLLNAGGISGNGAPDPTTP